MRTRTQYEYLHPLRTFLLVGSSIVLTVAAAITGYIWGFLLFLFSTIVNSRALWNPRTRVYWIGTKRYKRHLQQELDAQMADAGIFTYNDDGFEILLDGQRYSVLWSSIKAMYGYKVDMYVTDTICLDVIYDDLELFTITEGTEGWYVFRKHIEERFPEIDKSWHSKIVITAFAASLTKVYEREPDERIYQYYRLEKHVNSDAYYPEKGSIDT